jgi:hypothetical protein
MLLSKLLRCGACSATTVCCALHMSSFSVLTFPAGCFSCTKIRTAHQQSTSALQLSDLTLLCVSLHACVRLRSL